LGGEILLPRGEGKHPGIVMVHSSGHQSRNGPVAYFRLMANLLASSGYAVLIFDKRGVGESTGSWQSASLQDLAGDVQAAVRTLRNDAAVDGNRVGLWGISQGGWIAPIVAAEDARIAFLTLVSGAAITPAQQEIERVAMVMKANGSRQADIDAADRYLHTFFDVVAKVKPWSDLQSAMEQTANAPWLQYVPRPRNESQLGWTADFAGFDPAPVLGRVKAPILTFHGTDDVDVDARSNSALFARLAPNARSEHRIADGADHYMLSHVDDPDKESRRLVPQYWKSIIAWLARQR
jgi:pimeloyl-ACP methyl ester carboxylesterase